MEWQIVAAFCLETPAIDRRRYFAGSFFHPAMMPRRQSLSAGSEIAIFIMVRFAFPSAPTGFIESDFNVAYIIFLPFFNVKADGVFTD